MCWGEVVFQRFDKFHYMRCFFSWHFSFFPLFIATNTVGEMEKKSLFIPLSVGEQLTPQAISIVTMAANYCNALFAVNAAESSNLFWRKINAICQNSCLQMFKQAVCSVDFHQAVDSQSDDIKVEIQKAQ